MWKKSKQSVERLFYIVCAKSADEINEDKYLSATVLRKLEKETKNIQSADVTLVKSVPNK